MTKFKKTTLTALSIGIAIVIIGNYTMQKVHMWALALGMYVLVYAVICFSVGIILLAFTNKKEIGQGLLFSSAILILIGFSVCTRS